MKDTVQLVEGTILPSADEVRRRLVAANAALAAGFHDPEAKEAAERVLHEAANAAAGLAALNLAAFKMMKAKSH